MRTIWRDGVSVCQVRMLRPGSLGGGREEASARIQGLKRGGSRLSKLGGQESLHELTGREASTRDRDSRGVPSPASRSSPLTQERCGPRDYHQWWRLRFCRGSDGGPPPAPRRLRTEAGPAGFCRNEMGKAPKLALSGIQGHSVGLAWLLSVLRDEHPLCGTRMTVGQFQAVLKRER